MYNEKSINAKYNQNNQVENEMGTARSMHGEKINGNTISVRQLRGNRPLVSLPSLRIIFQ